MHVSVIVPARDARRTIGRCVDALLAQDYPHDRLEVIVVNDGSSDGTAAIARAHGADILGIQPSGPAVARNLGAARARGEILLFTDADCMPARDWVMKMAAPHADESSGPGRVIGTKGVYRTEQHSLTARFVQYEYESRYERMRRHDSIDFVDTYAAGFRRDLFLAAGGFDESFPGASVEDQEFSFRYARLGGRILFVPDAVVTHRHADSPYRYFRKKWKIAFWKMRVLRRHPDKIVTDSHTPQRLKLEMLAVLVALASAPFAWTFPGALIGGASLTVFLLSAMSLTVKMIGKDFVVGCAAPFFQLLRAVALGLGAVAGLGALLLERNRAGRDGSSEVVECARMSARMAVESDIVVPVRDGDICAIEAESDPVEAREHELA